MSGYYDDAVKYPPRPNEVDKKREYLFSYNARMIELFDKGELTKSELVSLIAHAELHIRRLCAIANTVPTIERQTDG